MSSGDLLNIQPSDLKFPFELSKQISCSLQLTNKTDEYVAFKVKTTNPERYCVRPNIGIVLPGATCDVTITMQAQKEAPPDMQCNDKFLLQSVTTPIFATGKEITREMFNKKSGKVVKEFKLGVLYVPANLLVTEESDPKASSVENGSRGTSLFDAASNSLLMGMSSRDLLLDIHPTELKFPFQLKKQSSCSLQLANKSDEYVAFKVKTTNPKKYCVRPNIGIVLPGATCDVTVTMQAQKEAPQDMQCKDKFLLQSVKAPNGATKKDITPEMFNKEIGKVVKEFKLRAAYVPVNPLLPEGSVEGSSPRASGVENGNQGTSLFDAKKRPTNLNIPGKVMALLGRAKTKIGSQFELRNREGYIELPNEEKLILASEKTQLEKPMLSYSTKRKRSCKVILNCSRKRRIHCIKL